MHVHGLMPACCTPCRRNAAEGVGNLRDGNLGNVGNVDNTIPNPFYVLTLASSVSDLKAVLLYARNDAAWGELSNATVSLSTSATLGAGNASVCARGVQAAGQGAVMKVECEGAAAAGLSSWQYVHVQRFTNGGGVNFGLAEIRVMRGGECG